MSLCELQANIGKYVKLSRILVNKGARLIRTGMSNMCMSIYIYMSICLYILKLPPPGKLQIPIISPNRNHALSLGGGEVSLGMPPGNCLAQRPLDNKHRSMWRTIRPRDNKHWSMCGKQADHDARPYRTPSFDCTANLAISAVGSRLKSYLELRVKRLRGLFQPQSNLRKGEGLPPVVGPVGPMRIVL